METVLVIIFLIAAIIIGLLATFSPRFANWGGVALAFIAAALLVPHLGIH